MSVEVLNEDWKMSGENMVLTIKIKAIVDTSNLKDRISKIQTGDSSESFKEVQNQLAALQKELAELKKQAQKQAESSGTKDQPSKEMKEKHEALVNEMSAWEYMEKGNIATVNQRWEEAEKAFGQVIALNPQIADAYAGKAFALYNLKKRDEAVELVDKALAIQPLSARSLSVKALILKDQPDKVDLAMDTINQAIKIQPNMPRSYRIRGEIFIKMGKFILAQKDFTKACQMGAKDACARLAAMEEKKPFPRRR
jgi:tetratricopeptide (TPR) repeat protein